jgi:hypothetical protein
MKKFSNYYKRLMCQTIFFGGFAIEAGLETMPKLCATLTVIALISWFAAINAPDYEKYKQ